MKWNNFFKLSSIFIFLLFNFSKAQNYKVSYDMNYRTDSLATQLRKKEMVLLVNKDKSKFYSLEQFNSDSLFIANKKAGIRGTAKHDYGFMLIKDKKTKKQLKFNKQLLDLYEISEDNPKFDWKISAETKKINNYNCQKATLNYSKRDWEAWFTTDVAIHDGPYIFNGLPGLIIDMKDKKGDYSFSFTGIKKDTDTDIDYLHVKPLLITKKQLNKALLDHYNDPYREIKAQAGGLKVKWLDENGKEFEPNYNQLTKEEQESIKTNNNPIELADVIKYP